MAKEPINLTTDELVNITGKIRPSSQIRILVAMNIPFIRRPDGHPLVARRAYLLAAGALSDQTPSSKTARNFAKGPNLSRYH